MGVVTTVCQQYSLVLKKGEDALLSVHAAIRARS
jgi:hypothetical protein